MKPNWEMTVPVLSTAHLPGRHAAVVDERMFSLVAGYDGGWFMLMFDAPEPDEPCYIGVLRKWLQREYPGEWWVRFDEAGDVVDELENFAYVWEAMEKAP